MLDPEENKKRISQSLSVLSVNRDVGQKNKKHIHSFRTEDLQVQHKLRFFEQKNYNLAQVYYPISLGNETPILVKIAQWK